MDSMKHARSFIEPRLFVMPDTGCKYSPKCLECAMPFCVKEELTPSKQAKYLALKRRVDARHKMDQNHHGNV